MFEKSLLAGMLGAIAVTALNESVRRISSKAPRLDKLGMDAAGKSLDAAGLPRPDDRKLFWGTMAADLVSNGLYYSLIGLAGADAKSRWLLGSGLGLAAGLGAVILPEPLQLDPAPTNRSKSTKAMAMAWYMAGALLATVVAGMLISGGEETE
jgi:hypothetical protein